MTLFITGDMIDRGNMVPESGLIYLKDDPENIIDKINLCYTEEEYEKEKLKGEWEEDEDIPGYYCCDNYLIWEDKMAEKWRKIYGKMWLHGIIDRETYTFPYKTINPEADENMYVKCYRFVSRNCWVNECIWNKKGITKEDYELGEELGLINPTNPEELKDDIYFNEMIDKQEEFMEDFNNFIDENDFIYSGSTRNCEVVFLNQVIESVEVRIESIGDKFALGSIDGKKEVYIPLNVIYNSENKSDHCMDHILNNKHCSISDWPNKKIKGGHRKNPVTSTIDYSNKLVGEVCLMDIKYTGVAWGKKNIWKAVHIHEKAHFLKGMFSTFNKMIYDVEIPKIDIGKVVGKNGHKLEKLRKSYIKEYPVLNKFWKSLDIEEYNKTGNEIYIPDVHYPKIDFNNKEDTCMCQIFQDNYTISVSKSENERYSYYSCFDPVKGILMKVV